MSVAVTAPTPTQTPLQMAVARLAESGLPADTLAGLNLTVLNAGEAEALGAPLARCLRINYMDPWNPGQALSVKPKAPGFYRLRLLENVADKMGKLKRYFQPAGTGVCAYFPTLIDWLPIKDNTKVPIFITEGELKAAKGCERGFATIGLGGVSNIYNTALGEGLLKEIEAIDWAMRNVYIVFDNDGMPKPEVNKAINKLADELCDLGAIVWNVALPSVAGKLKVGLDDYFVANPDKKAFVTLVFTSRQPLTLCRDLWALNKRGVVIRSPCMVMDVETFTTQRVVDFNLIHGKHTHRELKVSPEGTISQKKVPLGPAWLKWPLRAEASHVAFDPARPQGLLEDGGYNTWKGWSSTPVKGDVSPFLRLLDHIFDPGPGRDPKEARAARDWLVRWLAYPLQHPGTKMLTTAAVWGSQGSGKSLLAWCMQRIYGETFHKLNDRELDSDFNGWAARSLFVLGDDVTGSDKRSYASQLKSMITDPITNVNEKFHPSYSMPARSNFFFTSNECDAFFLDNDDRRFFIWQVTSPRMAKDVGRAIELWVDSAEGRNALHYYLLTYPLGDMRHQDPAMQTSSKTTMQQLGKSELDIWCAKLLEFPAAVLPADAVCDLYTSGELLKLYDPLGNTRTSTSGMGKALSRAGHKQVCGSARVVWSKDAGYYFAVRNRDAWVVASPAKVRDHLVKTKVVRISQKREAFV